MKIQPGMKQVSFQLSPSDIQALQHIKAHTGLNKSFIVRLMIAGCTLVRERDGIHVRLRLPDSFPPLDDEGTP